MATEPTHEEQIKQMEQELDLLKKKTELLNQQSALEAAQAKKESAELESIKEALGGLKFPEGKKGTITVAAGDEKTAFLRSKRPLLELLDEVAHELVEKCPDGTVLLTDEQLKKAYESKFQSNLIDEKTKYLEEIIKKITESTTTTKRKAIIPLTTASDIVSASLAAINSMSKLFRVDRELHVFNKAGEADKILRYLLDSMGNNRIVANPERVGSETVNKAKDLWKKLENLTQKLQIVNTNLDLIKKLPDVNADSLEANIKQANSLYEGLCKSDAFWKQVEGEVVAATINGKDLLFLEVQGQTIQIKESRWYTSDRILAIGEVQVLYRLLDTNGSVKKSGVILKSSKADNMKIDKLEPLNLHKP